MNRRDAIGFGLAGIALGGAWSGSFALAMRFAPPTIEVVGDGYAQIALLNTTRFRALFLIGTPGESLRQQIGYVLGFLRERLDLVIGTATAISSLGDAFRDAHHVARTIAVDDDAHAGAMRANLPQDVTLQLTIASLGAWKRIGEPTATWSAVITHADATVALGPDLDRLATTIPTDTALAIAPYGSLTYAARKLPRTALALNVDHVDETALLGEMTDDDPWIVRVHRNDRATFAFRNGGVTLPDWAVRAPIAD